MPAGCSSLFAAASPKCGCWPCGPWAERGNLDYVPSLLYALTDPDRRIVLEARNELRFISRNFDGIGPPDDFTEQQRFEAIDGWKKWYLSIRPRPCWKNSPFVIATKNTKRHKKIDRRWPYPNFCFHYF